MAVTSEKMETSGMVLLWDPFYPFEARNLKKLTNRATSVTLRILCGEDLQLICIFLNSAALAAVLFVVVAYRCCHTADAVLICCKSICVTSMRVA